MGHIKKKARDCEDPEDERIMPALKNAKREDFCQQYMIDNDGAKAARRAGYSEKTATVQAAQILAILNVQERIAELRADRLQRTQITQDEVLREIHALGMANFFDYAEPDEGGGVKIKMKDDIPIEKQGAVKGMKVKRRIFEDQKDDSEQMVVIDSIEYIMHDKVQPLKMLANHVGLVVDRMHLNGKLKLKVNGKMQIQDLRDSHAKATGK
jgi:phage terminase small subunit